jgi:hypothetical protein
MYRIRLAFAMTRVPAWAEEHVEDVGLFKLPLPFLADARVQAFGNELQPIGGWVSCCCHGLRREILRTAERAVLRLLEEARLSDR